jgi:hypothetical protein
MRAHGRFAAMIQRRLESAIQAGRIAPLDAETAAWVWFGAINEVVVRWLISGQPERLESAFPALRALLLRSVGALPAETTDGAEGTEGTGAS